MSVFRQNIDQRSIFNPALQQKYTRILCSWLSLYTHTNTLQHTQSHTWRFSFKNFASSAKQLHMWNDKWCTASPKCLKAFVLWGLRAVKLCSMCICVCVSMCVCVFVCEKESVSMLYKKRELPHLKSPFSSLSAQRKLTNIFSTWERLFGIVSSELQSVSRLIQYHPQSLTTLLTSPNKHPGGISKQNKSVLAAPVYWDQLPTRRSQALHNHSVLS